MRSRRVVYVTRYLPHLFWVCIASSSPCRDTSPCTSISVGPVQGLGTLGAGTRSKVHGMTAEYYHTLRCQ